MADIILHHYPESPYAEKVRRVFGFKGLSWRSVLIPMVMPKPDLLALTGGYRKTPVLQMGADVFCDTDLIVRVLERLRPDPTLFPDGAEGLASMVGPWQSELFSLVVFLWGSLVGFPDGFLDDRATMFEGGIDIGRAMRELPAKRDQLRAKLDLLERQLADGRPFVLGARASLADFSLYHPLWAARTLPPLSPVLEPCHGIRAWLGRIDAFGHGESVAMNGADAVEMARQASPRTQTLADPHDPNGRAPGDRVEVVHESFGRDPVVGELVMSSVHEIAIRRHDARTGEVVVHFPREHYLVLPA